MNTCENWVFTGVTGFCRWMRSFRSEWQRRSESDGIMPVEKPRIFSVPSAFLPSLNGSQKDSIPNKRHLDPLKQPP